MQDGYCAASLTFGNATSGTFGQPPEVFDLQQLLQVPQDSLPAHAQGAAHVLSLLAPEGLSCHPCQTWSPLVPRCYRVPVRACCPAFC